MSLFPNRVGIRYRLVILFVFPLNGFLLTPSPKFSSHFLIQPPYLGLLEGTMKLTIGLKFGALFLGLEPCSSSEFRFIDILEM